MNYLSDAIAFTETSKTKPMRHRKHNKALLKLQPLLCEQLAKPILIKKNDGTEVLSHYEISHLILSRELSRTTNAHKVEKLFAELIRSGVLTVKMQRVEGQQPIPISPRTYIVRINI